MGTMTIKLVGRLDTSNGDKWYEETTASLAEQAADLLELDCDELESISSLGLRKLLYIIKSGVRIRCTNVSTELYDIFDVTGFTMMMDIRKKPRQLKIDDSDLLARGTVGLVYRLDEDRVLKIFNRNVTLDLIQRERKYAQKALMAGIPTVISYDIVQVDDCYGIIYEMAQLETFSKKLRENIDRFDSLADGYAALLKLVHQTDVSSGEFPRAKEIYHSYIERASYLSDTEKVGLHKLVDSVPDRNTVLHGDYHANNIMFQDDEMILIDLGDISQGHPVFDLAGMYVSHVLVGGYQPAFIRAGMGIDYDTCLRLWDHTILRYFDGESESGLQRKRNTIRQFAYLKLALMYVIAPGIEKYLTWKPLEDARCELFPRIEEVRAALEEDDLSRQEVIDTSMNQQEKTIVCMGSFNPVTIAHLSLFDQILEKHESFHLFVRYNEGVDLTSWEVKKGWFERINAERGNRIILHKLSTDKMKGKQYNKEIFSAYIQLFEDELGKPIHEVWVGEDAAPLVEAAKKDFPNIDFVVIPRNEINSTAIRADLEGHRDWLPPFVYDYLKTMKNEKHV